MSKTFEQMNREKFATKEGKPASQGFLRKLQRVMMAKHNTSFDERAFCQQHGIILRKFERAA